MGLELHGVLSEVEAIFNGDGIKWCLERSESNGLLSEAKAPMKVDGIICF